MQNGHLVFGQGPPSGALDPERHGGIYPSLLEGFACGGSFHRVLLHELLPRFCPEPVAADAVVAGGSSRSKALCNPPSASQHREGGVGPSMNDFFMNFSDEFLDDKSLSG